MRDLTGVMKILLNWIMVIIGKFTRNYCILKCVKFMVCKLWLNYVFKKGTVKKKNCDLEALRSEKQTKYKGK